jgi:glycerol dehydrogenase-like iron-containing ADH family enzyme
VSYFNTCLEESKELSTHQDEQFWELVEQVTNVFGVGTHTPQSMAVQDLVKNAWNAMHRKLQHADGGTVVGLGGLMRSKHAASLLKDRGHEIRTQRVLEMPQGPPLAEQPPPPHATLPQATTKTLTAADVASKSSRDCVPWLKAAGLPSTTGNVEQKRKRLSDYFSRMPPGHKLKLS